MIGINPVGLGEGCTALVVRFGDGDEFQVVWVIERIAAERPAATASGADQHRFYGG